MVEPNAGACPNCGLILTHVDTRDTLTNSVVLDAFLGVLLAAGLFLLYGGGVIVDPILFLVFRKKSRVFARAIIITWTVVVVVVLGAFTICMAILSDGKWPYSWPSH